jgi:hypothetical protein
VIKTYLVTASAYMHENLFQKNEYDRIRKYIQANPVRRGLVPTANDYFYSSAVTAFRMDEIPEGLKPETILADFDACLKARTTRANNVLS